MTSILGISAFYHDSAAALLVDGKIIAAAQEERFSRIKGDAAFPAQAVNYCLREAGIEIAELDHLVFYDKPLLKFDRILETAIAIAPAGYRRLVLGIPLWLKEKLWLESIISKETGFAEPVLFGDHHESHAASAFYPSPYQSAAILTVDGVGEWSTTTLGHGHGSEIELTGELNFPHSLGLLYSTFTQYLGFKVNSGEYKVMGLAPYGQPRFASVIYDNLMDLKPDGSFRLNMEYFDFLGGMTMINERFKALFGGAPRNPESEISQRQMDLARSIQEVTEEILLRLAATVKSLTGENNLCLAGGVALNCVANGRLLRSGLFDDIWIQPAAGDAGGALGAALAVWHRYLGNERKTRRSQDGDSMCGALLGPAYDDKQIEAVLKEEAVPFDKLENAELALRVAQLLDNGKIIGWFSGRMEFGPRALGARSILGDARDPTMQTRMNLKTKFRESFRPFAPVVKEDRLSDWFELDRPSPYMLLVADVAPARLSKNYDRDSRKPGFAALAQERSEIQAVTHVDCSARIQTIRREINPLYYDVLDEFEKRTGCPVLVNTSFNVRGEPIVESPRDALTCFMRTDIDYLVMGPYLIDKSTCDFPPPGDSWRKELPLD